MVITNTLLALLIALILYLIWMTGNNPRFALPAGLMPANRSTLPPLILHELDRTITQLQNLLALSNFRLN